MSLAHLRELQCELATARSHWERALEITERVLGPDHPSTATSLNGLAGLLRAQRELAPPGLAIRERVLGPSHPRTVTIRESLNEFLTLLKDHPRVGAGRRLDRGPEGVPSGPTQAASDVNSPAGAPIDLPLGP